MRINKLNLENVFSYYGNVKFDFSNSKSLNVIIGENGFGKTSLINSIKIALHGITKEVLRIGDYSLTKQEYIMGSNGFSGIINRVAKEQGTKESSIIINFEDEKLNIHTIKRCFKITNTSYSEYLTVTKESTGTVLIDDEAQDYINSKIINPSLAKFFLFDGERVQDIANFSSEEFAKMLENVFEEIGIFEQLIEDIKILKRTYQTESITDKSLQNLFIEKNNLIDLKNKEIENFIENIKSKKIDLREFKKTGTELKNKIEKLKSENKIEFQEVEKELSSLSINRDKKLDVFKAQAVTCLPLLLDKELKLKVESDIFANYYDLNYLPKEIIERKKIEFIQLINEKIQNGEDISNIMEIFDKVFFSENQEKRVSFVDTTKIKYQFESLNLQVLAFGILLDNIIEIDTLIKEQEDRLSTLKEAIKQNEKALDLLLENKEKNSNKIAILESEIENFDKNINDNRLLIKDTEKEIHQISMRTHKEDVLNEKISTCGKTILVCQESIDITKIKKREELEKNVNEKLNLLIKDSYDAAHLKVYEDFTINLFDKNDKKMDILSSSSGQKQIIATALIWAISEYANTNMPMIVDTPLGRLDDKNQQLLLDNFYPNVAKQVIMLPTPSELKAEGFKNIINNATIFKLSSNGSIATVERV